MIIRRAEKKDIPGIDILLLEIANLHAEGRPDIIIKGKRKYTDSELEAILLNDMTPVFVAEENGEIVGQMFGIFRIIKENEGNQQPMKSLYIDDLCVRSDMRRRHIGRALFEYTKEFAKAEGAYHITLNVWEFNESAIRFYESLGMKPFKTVMETIL